MLSRDDLIEAHEDIKTPIMLNEKPILKEGWLQKQSRHIKDFRKKLTL